MSNLSNMKNILNNQTEHGIKSGDWERLSYEVEKEKDGKIILNIEILYIGIVFTPKGRLVGMFNYKD